MTNNVRWAHPFSGYFSAAADRVGGVPPGTSDDPWLDDAGAPFTVTSNTNPSINGIDLSANATPRIAPGTGFRATYGTDAGDMLAGEYDASGNILRRDVPGPGIDEPNMLLRLDFFRSHRVYVSLGQRKVYVSLWVGRCSRRRQPPMDRDSMDPCVRRASPILQHILR